jgi:hypothetical protein
VADPLLAITAELGEPLMVVGAEERTRWHQPIVYAWIRAEEVLYVGCSWVGTERPLSAKHEKLRAFQPGDRLAVWACADPGPLERVSHPTLATTLQPADWWDAMPGVRRPVEGDRAARRSVPAVSGTSRERVSPLWGA